MAFSKIIAESMDLTDAYNFTGTLQQNGAGIGGANTPAFHAFLSANLGIANNSTTKITCNTEIFDSNSAYDNSSNYRFTVPSGEAGKYYLYGSVRPNTSSDYEYSEAYIRINGSDKIQATLRNTGRDVVNVYGTLDLSVGDYAEIFYYHNEGNNIELSGNSSVSRTFFGGFKIII